MTCHFPFLKPESLPFAELSSHYGIAPGYHQTQSSADFHQ